MFTKMMVCTDLTPDSFLLIACAVQLQEIDTKEIVLVHVVETLAAVSGTLLSAEAESVLQRQKEMLERHFTVQAEVLHGSAAHALDAAADSHKVNGILIGSHSEGLMPLAKLGSVSAALLARTLHPVLLYRVDLGTEGVKKEACGNLFNRILFPTDFSETAEKALDYLGKIALERRGGITLLHVISADEEDAGARSEEDAQYLLEAKKRRLERLGAAEVAIDMAHGDPADEIVSRGSGGEYSLVVMGSQAKEGVARVFSEGTAEHVVRRIQLPVLLIPGVHHAA